MSENLKVDTITPVKTNTQVQPAEIKEKKKLINHEFTTTEKVIGGLSALTLLGVGIYAAMRKGKPPKRIKTPEPEVSSPHIEPQPEIRVSKPEPAAEKPLEQEIEKVVEKNFKELKEDLVKTAISPEEFNKIGKIEKGRAVLNNGEPYTGAILTAGENGFGKRYLREYQDGVLREMTEMQVSPKGNISGTTNFSFKNWKYDKNGKVIERSSLDGEEGVLEYVTKYFKDLEGNKIKETFTMEDGELKLKNRITDFGINTMFERFHSDRIFRIVKNKNGSSRAFSEELQTGNIIPLGNKYEEIFKDADGVKKYKIFHGYSTNDGKPFQYTEVFGADGKKILVTESNSTKPVRFAVGKPNTKLHPDDITYQTAIFYNDGNKIVIYHPGTYQDFQTKFEVTGNDSVIYVKEADWHGGSCTPDEKIGMYNMETGEISCNEWFNKGEYGLKFSEVIKGIIERIYGTEKPVPIKQLYGQKMKIINDLMNNKELKPEKVEIPW